MWVDEQKGGCVDEVNNTLIKEAMKTDTQLLKRFHTKIVGTVAVFQHHTTKT